MADLIYNPLLKKGFQEAADTGSIEAEIDDLRQHKITKCLTAADLASLADGEIFQWQGEDATIDSTSFKNGYFYKCTTNSITLPTGTQYFDNDFDVVNLYGYDVRIGRFFIIEDNTPAAGNDYYHFRVMAYTDSPDYIFFNYTFPTIGEAVWNRANNEVVTVISVDENLTLHLSDGHTVTTANSSWSHPYKIYKVLSDYGKYFNVCSCGQMNVYIFLPDYVVNGNTFTVNDYFTIQHSAILETVEPTEIGQNAYAQTDTQPRVNGISNDEGGDVAISTDVTIAGNLTVQGTQTTVHTQEIDSESDNINLRVNNPLGLENGEESGVKVLNYDGNNTNCFLGVDNQGWARVGDEGGTLEKLATIEETPTDGQFVQYDAQNKQLKTAAIPEATTTAAGLMSAENYNKINLSYKNGDGSQNMTATFFLDIAADVLNKGFNQKTVIATIITNGSYCSGLITVFRFNNNIYGSILLMGYNFFRAALINNSVVSIYEINKTIV